MNWASSRQVWNTFFDTISCFLLVTIKNKDFEKFKSECSKTGTTEESIAQGEKIGFKTSLFASIKSDLSVSLASIIFSCVG